MHIVRIKPQRVVDHPRIKQSHEARHQYNTAHRPPGRRHTPPAPPCVPVLLCWHRLQPWGASHYMRAQGYNVSDSNTTRILPTLQLQVQCNLTRTLYSTQTQQTPPWRIFSTTLNLSMLQTSMYSGLGLSSS